ncbi:uncharacterized protein LOC125940250 [Dermacentor silvarum]|uniref:uncharacterized protein LOC125940250 n=1 Tax=Dermacentor silvarum TaxID=543639 RepID=UPI002100AE5C|nr:uncharacterized protein LOC125940250 [Dermacentor silvarum]
MALGSRKLLDLFREAASFESSSGIARLVRQRADRGRCFRAFRRVGVAASATATLSCCVAIIIENHLNDKETAWSYGLPVLLVRLLSQVGFAFWECTMYIVVSSVSEVLVSYLRSQKYSLRECQRSVQEQRSDDLTAALAVEAIRKNMSAIRKMKTCINVIWEPAILASSLCFLWVHCIAWYCLFTEEAYHLRIWLGLAYSCYSSLRFLDLAVVSHDLCNEARSIQQVSKDANLVHVSDTYMRQIHFLHDSA